MSHPLTAVVDEILSKTYAVAAVVWSEGRIVFTSVTDGPPAGSAWTFSPQKEGILTPGELSGLPTALRLEVPGPVHGGYVTRIANARLLLLWCVAPLAAPFVEESLTASRARGLDGLIREAIDNQRLRADSARFQAVNAALPQGVITTDNVSGVAFVNEAAARLIGVEPGELPISQVADALVHLQKRARDADAVQAVALALTGDPRAVIPETVWELRGSPTHLAVTSSPVNTALGQGRVWVFDDVSSHFALVEEARQARLEQAEADERFRLAMTYAGVGVGVLSADGVCLDANTALLRILGKGSSDVVGHRWPEFTDPADERRCQRLLQEVRRGDRDAFSQRGQYARGAGRTVWIDLSAAAVRDVDGGVRYFVNHVRDVNKEVIAELAAARERHLLRTVSDGVLDPLVLLEAVRDEKGVVLDFRYLEANQATVHYLGLAREELIGHGLLEYSPNIRSIGLFERYVETIETNGALHMSDIVFDNEILAATRRYDLSAVGINGMLSLTWRDVTDRFNDAVRLADSEQRFRLLAENTSDVVMRLSLEGIIEWVSPSVKSLLGFSPEQLYGTRNLDLVHPDHKQQLATSAERAGRTGERLTLTLPLITVDGTYRWMESAGDHVPADGDRPAFRIVRLRSVDEEVKAYRELASSEARFRAAMASAPGGVAIVSNDRRFLQVNRALCNLLGRSQRWLLAHGMKDVIHPDDDQSDLNLRARLLAGGPASGRQEIRMMTAEGGFLWVDHAIGLIREEDGTAVSSVSQFEDITAARETGQLLQFLADHDPLTDLKNRRGIVSTIAAVLSHPPRTGTRLGVLFCDVDGLKPVNDTYGHAAGDAVLVEVARRLRRTIRSGDSVGRLGGDEFVVVLISLTGVDDACRIAEKLRAQVAKPIDVDGRSVRVTVSVGVKVADPGDDPDEVLRQADVALYQAKATGRDRVVVHSGASGTA